MEFSVAFSPIRASPFAQCARPVEIAVGAGVAGSDEDDSGRTNADKFFSRPPCGVLWVERPAT
jgi:hypothetical protein